MSLNANGAMCGEITMRIENVNNERRIYLTIDGLPRWALGMLRDAGPFRNAGATYHCVDDARGTGPDVVALEGALVFVAAEPKPAPPADVQREGSEP